MTNKIFNEAIQEEFYKDIAGMLNNDNDEKKAYFNGVCIVFNEHPLTIEEKASKIIDYIEKEIEKYGKIIGTTEFIDYVIENLKQKKHLNIYGCGHSLMLYNCKHNNYKNIFRRLDDLKEGYILYNKIIETICSYFSLTKELLLSKRRKRKLVIARQYTVFLLRKYGTTYERIGKYLNLNHSTCVYSFKTINDLLSVDREIERQLEEIEIALSQQ